MKCHRNIANRSRNLFISLVEKNLEQAVHELKIGMAAVSSFP
jgi:hypothetical protein